VVEIEDRGGMTYWGGERRLTGGLLDNRQACLQADRCTGVGSTSWWWTMAHASVQHTRHDEVVGAGGDVLGVMRPSETLSLL
jgi:hypothetical protein